MLANNNLAVRFGATTRDLFRGRIWTTAATPRAMGGLLVFLGYYLGAKLGLALTFQPHPVSVMWPPNAILLAALLLSRTRDWWLLLACALPAHLLAELQGNVPLGMVLCWFVSNCSEALLGASITRRLLGESARFDRVQSIGVLFLSAGLVAPFFTSFLDAGFVSLNHFGAQGYWQVWKMRLCSNVFCALTLGTTLVVWGTHEFNLRRALRPQRWVEGSLLALGLLFVTFLTFGREAGPERMPALLYAPVLFFLWAAIRFELAGTSAAILSVALLAIWNAVHGHGPFSSRSPELNAFSIQAFFVLVSVTMTFLAASLAERRRAEERFTQAFRSSPDAMLISRLSDGQIIEVNNRWEELFGYERRASLGQTISGLKLCEPGNALELLTGEPRAQKLQAREMALRTSHGEMVPVSVSADSAEIGGENCLVTTIRDLSDRKRLEEAQQNLIHASRLAVVGELTAMIAHEIRQPLGAILTNAEAAELLLQSGAPPLDEIRSIVQDIRQSDLRAHEAIQRIRALLRNRKPQMDPLDLNDTVSDVLKLVAADAGRRQVIIQSELATGLPQVSGDRVHLQQLLLNLLLNGMESMADTDKSQRQLTVRTSHSQDGKMQVSVEDAGTGINPDDLPRIFNSFFSTKRDGMGLGLSIAKSIIEAHKGRIWAENNQGRGATIHFTLSPA
ncbi:MAG TPA: ATP-binding protein [Candidatus Dormibacteraeota bacterium]|nr:ATP-binding protein [Candidatus Dormibacteraeota bacterium]